jgi:hypothetical protein
MVMTFDRLPYKSKANADEVKSKEVKSNENEAEVQSKENGDEVVQSNENEAEVKTTGEEGKTNGDEDKEP